MVWTLKPYKRESWFFMYLLHTTYDISLVEFQRGLLSSVVELEWQLVFLLTYLWGYGYVVTQLATMDGLGCSHFRFMLWPLCHSMYIYVILANIIIHYTHWNLWTESQSSLDFTAFYFSGHHRWTTLEAKETTKMFRSWIETLTWQYLRSHISQAHWDPKTKFRWTAH